MWSPKHLTVEQKEERRLSAVSLLENRGLSESEIARRLGVSRQIVSRWAHELRSVGASSLQRRPHRGCPGRLSAEKPKGTDVILALKHIRRHLPGTLIIAWDRLSTRKDVRAQQWIAQQPDLYVEWLPPYAPTLKPEELCHGDVKVHLRGAMPEDEAELRRQVDRDQTQTEARHADRILSSCRLTQCQPDYLNVNKNGYLRDLARGGRGLLH